MLSKVAIPVALALLVAATCAATAGEPDSQEPAWLFHQDSDAGFEILYPADWEVIVAEQRLAPDATWSPLILGEGELAKLAFRERGEVPWPGWYEVRVLANPDSLSLEDYWENFDLSDLWDRSAADSTLAGRPSKTLVRWRYDSLTREHLLLTTNGVMHILYDEHNSNDPDFQHHQRVYGQMTSTLRLLSVDEQEGDSKAVPPN